MGLLAFLIIVQSLILLVHWIVFESMRHYFSLQGMLAYGVFWVFLLAAFAFLLSTIATRVAPGRLSRLAYRVAAFWLGTMHFFFLTAVAIALLELCSGFLRLSMPTGLALLLYLTALVLGLLAWIRRKKITVVRQVVTLPFLGEAWVGKKLFFFADTHYGAVHREEAAKNLVQLIQAEKPDLICMGGDFFDGPPIDPSLVTAPYRDLIQSIPAFFVSGNHEEYGKKADFLRSLGQNGFRIINDEKVIMDGLQIVGLDFMTTRTEAATRMTLQRLALDPTLPTIVLKHIPRHIETIESLGGHLLLCGHTHQGQVWPLNLVTHLLYKGFDYGLRRYRKLFVYTTSGAGSWGPPQRLGTQAEVVVFTLAEMEQV